MEAHTVPMAGFTALRPALRAVSSCGHQRSLAAAQGFARRSAPWQPRRLAAPARSAAEPEPLPSAAAGDPPASSEATSAAPAQSEAPEQQQPAGPAPVWQRLLRGSASKVAANLWPLVLVHALCDASVFALHRISHRLTNEGMPAFL